jgi:hypothetical protein
LNELDAVVAQVCCQQGADCHAGGQLQVQHL